MRAPSQSRKLYISFVRFRRPKLILKTEGSGNKDKKKKIIGSKFKSKDTPELT